MAPRSSSNEAPRASIRTAQMATLSAHGREIAIEASGDFNAGRFGHMR